MDLSIIIVNYNVKEFLQNCLVSIERASKNLDVETIVIDNASEDGSQDMLRERFPNVRLVASETNLGFGKANNLGLDLASGDHLLVLNPDTILGEETLDVMIRFMREKPEAGMAGCKALNSDGSFQLSCRRGFPGPWASFTKLTGLAALFPKSKLFAKYNLTYLDEDGTYEVDALSGSFIMLPRAAYEKIGGFDERFFMYGEDLDWCHRAKEAGYEVWYTARTRFIHYKGESSKKSDFVETRVFYDAMRLFVEKHYAASFVAVPTLKLAIFLKETAVRLHRSRLRWAPAIFDAALFNGILHIAAHEYAKRQPAWDGFPEGTEPVVYTVPLALQLLVNLSVNVYQKRWVSTLRAAAASAIGFLVLSTITYFFKEWAFSRAAVLLTYVGFGVAAVGWRALYSVFFQYRRNPHYRRRNAVVVGSDESARAVAEKLDGQTASRYRVVGLIAASRKEAGGTRGDFEIIGSVENLRRLVAERNVGEIVFPPGDLAFEEMMKIVSNLQGEEVEFRVAGRNLDFVVGKASVALLDDLPLVELSYNISKPVNRLVKRLVDLALAFPVLILVYPLLYFWNRLSRAEPEWRRFFLDAPNIVSGKKSVVGPKDAARVPGLYLGKPGATGLWRLEPERDGEKLDVYYARRQNVWLDFEIIGKTVASFLATPREPKNNYGENDTRL